MLNVERYGVEEDEDEEVDVDDDDAKKNANSFLAFVCVSCEVVGRRVCAEGGK